MRSLFKIAVQSVLVIACIATLICYVAGLDAELPSKIAGSAALVWVVCFDCIVWDWHTLALTINGKPKKKKSEKPDDSAIKDCTRCAELAMKGDQYKRRIVIFKDGNSDDASEQFSIAINAIESRKYAFYFLLMPDDIETVEDDAFEMIAKLYGNGYEFLGNHRIGANSIQRFVRIEDWRRPDTIETPIAAKEPEQPM